MTRRAPVFFALAALVLALPAAPAGAGPWTHPKCPGAHPTQTFVTGKGMLENLFFDGAGGLYVTGDEQLRRYDRHANETVLISGESLGGIARGPDGAIYVGHGNVIADSATRWGGSGVWRLKKSDPRSHTVYAEGFDMANGLAFDAAGNLYVSNDFGTGPVRIPAGDPSSWTVWGAEWGTNGLVVRDGWLYAAETFDGASRIVRMRLDDPSVREVVAALSIGAFTLEPALHVPPHLDGKILVKGLDDMTSDAAGNLYVTANGAAGELLKVDPATGSACVLASGLTLPSSVRFATGFGPAYNGKLFVTGFGGSITVVTP